MDGRACGALFPSLFWVLAEELRVREIGHAPDNPLLVRFLRYLPVQSSVFSVPYIPIFAKSALIASISFIRSL